MSPRSKKLSQEMREQSRTALVEAARKLFAERGYFNCRISDIAAQAGMSQGNVYWYFSSKEALLKAVLADGFDTLGETMAKAAAQTGSSQEKLGVLIDNLVNFGRQRGAFNAIMLSLLGHGGDALFAELGFDMPQIGLGYTQSVAAIIAQAQQEGLVAKDVDPVIPSMFFFAFFNGMHMTYGQEWLDIPLETLRSAILRLMGVQTK